jgi:hypothetical protein
MQLTLQQSAAILQRWPPVFLLCSASVEEMKRGLYHGRTPDRPYNQRPVSLIEGGNI